MILKGIILTSLFFSVLAFGQTYSVVKVEILCEALPLDKSMNSDANDFCPFVFENAIYFASDRDPDLVLGGENNWSSIKHVNLFRAEYKGDLSPATEMKSARLISEQFAFGTHTGPACLSITGDTLFLSQVAVDAKSGTFRPQLFYAVKVNNRFGRLVALPFNNPENSFAHPFYDSGTKKLYFSSDKPGGEGGFDLYYSELTDMGWGVPNAIKDVNTVEDEKFPYVMENFLFFASNRKSKKAGLDIYWKILDGTPECTLIEGLYSEHDDFGIYVLPGLRKGYFSSNRNGNDDIFFLNMERRVTVRNEMSGVFSFRQLQGLPANMVVQIVDENNFVIYETKTNDKGEFVFANINYDKSYSIRAISEEELDLELKNQDGTAAANLLADEKNVFTYRKLGASTVGTLSLIPADMVDFTLNQGHLSAQLLYEDKANEFPVGEKVMLVNENGDIVYQTVTDKNGNFEFKKLSMSENYMLKLENIEEDMILLIYDLKGNVVAEMKTNENGTFNYQKINPDVRNNLTLLEEDEEMFEYNAQTIWGYFEYENDKKLNREGLIVKAFTQDGQLVSQQITDKNGMFRFRDLPVDRNLLFTLEENGQIFILDDFTLFIFDRNGQKIAGLRRGQEGYFTYRPLGYDNSSELSLMEEQHLDFILGNKNVRSRISVYFDSNQSQVKSDDMTILNNLYKVLKDNPAIRIEINAYADAKSSDEYNLVLSEKRGEWIANYLIKKGIKADRMIVNAYGESRLVDVENDALNRRAEIHLY